MDIPVDDLYELTLTLDTNAYAADDVLAETQEIEAVFRVPSGTVILTSLVMLDKDDQGGALDIVFLRSNTSIGTENAALNIADGDADEILTVVPISAADYEDLINSQIAIKKLGDLGMGVVLKPTGDDSLYVAAISRGTKTYSASGIVLKIGLMRS